MAGNAIMEIYEDAALAIRLKEDESPLTKADIASNKVINRCLEETGIPIISEENKQIPYEVRKQWNQCWIVDPLDGTKEFIKRNGEFTVNIALVEDGIPLVGVIYVPVSQEVFCTTGEPGMAYKINVREGQLYEERAFTQENLITPKQVSGEHIRVVGSRSHMNQETEEFISELKKQYAEVDIVSRGSSLKFCLLAEGKANIYPRFAPTMEWDTAAGHAICRAAGLRVISKETNEELKYNKENLLNSHFVVQ